MKQERSGIEAAKWASRPFLIDLWNPLAWKVSLLALNRTKNAKFLSQSPGPAHSMESEAQGRQWRELWQVFWHSTCVIGDFPPPSHRTSNWWWSRRARWPEASKERRVLATWIGKNRLATSANLSATFVTESLSYSGIASPSLLSSGKVWWGHLPGSRMQWWLRRYFSLLDCQLSFNFEKKNLI